MNALLPGFADPVRDSQSCFRALLQAMSRPGTLMHTGEDLRAPGGLCQAAAAALLALADADTPVWLDGEAADARSWLDFHCGAPASPAAADAAFIVTTTLPDLTLLPAGTHDAPELSATIIVQVAALGEGRRYTLRGPGLEHPGSLSVTGLPADFAAAWAANHTLYPRGIDLILCAGATLTALPRTVHVTEI